MEQTVSAQKRPAFWKRQFIVNKEFQLKYVGVIIVTFFIVMGLVIWYIDLILKSFIPSIEMMERGVEIVKSELPLIVGIVLLMMMLCLVMILLTFRIAGPIFRIERDIKDMITTGNLRELKIRKGDEGENLVIAINQLINKIKERK